MIDGFAFPLTEDWRPEKLKSEPTSPSIMNLIRRLSKPFLAAILFLAPGSLRADDPKNAIIQATMRYVFQEAGVDDPSVTVEEVTGGFARVKVVSLSGATDPAKAFLKGGADGKWKVLVLGTGFAPGDLAELGIPASLAD